MRDRYDDDKRHRHYLRKTNEQDAFSNSCGIKLHYFHIARMTENYFFYYKKLISIYLMMAAMKFLASTH